jgi:predicted metal-binding protein
MTFKEKFKTRRIAGLNKIPLKVLKKDLKKYTALARELGSDDAVIIPARKVRFDERVRIKCRVPMCHLYGSSPNCPPYTPDVETMKRAMKKYRWALLFRYDVPNPDDFIDQEKWLKGHEKHQRKIHDIVSILESVAFNDGYYFAVGFSAGGCKTALCSGMVCQFLDSGRCRFPLKSRPSMEGVGIDTFELAARVGWEIYPIASRYSDPASIKCAVSMGILFIN